MFDNLYIDNLQFKAIGLPPFGSKIKNISDKDCFGNFF